jgi:hypothetical protein
MNLWTERENIVLLHYKLAIRYSHMVQSTNSKMRELVFSVIFVNCRHKSRDYLGRLKDPAKSILFNSIFFVHYSIVFTGTTIFKSAFLKIVCLQNEHV